jgi:hypothetical protein
MVLKSSREANALPPKQLVCVYAQEDEEYFRELKVHLHWLVHQQKIFWLETRVGDAQSEIAG